MGTQILVGDCVGRNGILKQGVEGKHTSLGAVPLVGYVVHTPYFVWVICR